MGFFDFIGTIGGGVVGALAYAANPLLGAAVGAGLGSSIDASNAQADALEAAGDIQAANAIRQQALQQQFLSETAGFRDLAREQLPLLRAEAGSEAGTSQPFQRNLQRGLTSLRQNFAGAGLGDSSALGLASGEFASGLTAADANRLTNLRLGLAQGVTTGFGQALGSAQLGQGAASGLANTAMGLGAARAGGIGGLGSGLTTLPLLFGAGGFGSPGGTAAGAGKALFGQPNTPPNTFGNASINF